MVRDINYNNSYCFPTGSLVRWFVTCAAEREMSTMISVLYKDRDYRHVVSLFVVFKVGR